MARAAFWTETVYRLADTNNPANLQLLEVLIKILGAQEMVQLLVQ